MWIVLLLMALSYQRGVVQWLAASTVGTTYIVDTSFPVTAIRLYWTGMTATVDSLSGAIHLRRGVGFAVSTSSRACVVSQDQDAATTMICTTGYQTDCVAATITSTPVVDGKLDVSAFTGTAGGNGFTLIVDDQGVVNVTIMYEAWGGTSVAVVGEIAEPAATGDVDYTVTGFVAGSNDDQIVMLAGCQATGAANATPARNDSGLFMGYAGGTGLGNVVMVDNSDDAFATADTDYYAQTGECLAMIIVAGGNPDARAALTQFGTNNFRLNWISRGTTNRKSIFLALKGGNWVVGNTTIDTTTLNATAAVSGLPFDPIGLSVLGTTHAAFTAGTSGSFGIINAISFGTATGTGARMSLGWLSQDTPTAANVNLIAEFDEICAFTSEVASLYALFDLSAWGSGGFTFIVDDSGSGASAASWIGYLTFGNAAAGPAFMPKQGLMVNTAVTRASTW